MFELQWLSFITFTFKLGIIFNRRHHHESFQYHTLL